MDPDTMIMEELKRVEAKTAMVFSLDGALIAVTVAVIGLGHVPDTAKILMGVAQLLLLAAIVPLIVAVFPRVMGSTWGPRGETFGISAWSLGLEDNPATWRRMLAKRALDGYRMVALSMVILVVALIVLTCAGVLASFS